MEESHRSGFVNEGVLRLKVFDEWLHYFSCSELLSVITPDTTSVREGAVIDRVFKFYKRDSKTKKASTPNIFSKQKPIKLTWPSA